MTIIDEESTESLEIEMREFNDYVNNVLDSDIDYYTLKYGNQETVD